MAKAKDSTALNLKGLKTIGGILTGQAVERDVKWETTNDDGETVTHEFKVGVVKLGIAATERIYGSKDDQSRWALMIHEAVRLGEGFTERIPYEDACNLDQGLFMALSDAASSVNPKAKEADGPGKE